MKPGFSKLTPAQKLSVLAEILESGELVPIDLAVDCARLIRKAIKTGGKLPLKTASGHPANRTIRFERAFAVAMLIIDAGLKRNTAVQQVADSCGKKFSTVRKDYSKWHALVNQQAHRKIHLRDTILPAIDELKKLLRTFAGGNGSTLSDADIDELFSWLPASEVAELVKKIKNRPLHRDLKLLSEFLS